MRELPPSKELVAAPENPTLEDLIAFYGEDNFRSGLKVRVPYRATRLALEKLRKLQALAGCEWCEAGIAKSKDGRRHESQYGVWACSANEPPDVPSVEPIARVINNNQPGWTNIVETAPNVTLDVGAPLYSRESVMRLAAALAGAIDRAAQPPSPELPAPLITLNGRQVAEIYDFIDLAAGSTSGFETDVSIQWFEERPPVDGEPSPAGYYAWITDYPEEGSIYLNDQPTLTKRTGRCPHGYELANLDDGTDTCKGCSPEGERNE